MRIALALSVLILVGGCSTQPKTVLPKPAIKSIAIIPATNPAAYTLENVSATQFVIPLAATFNYLDSKEKAKKFNERMEPSKSPLATDFTNAVAAALRSHGYDVEVLQNIVRPSDYPDSVDHEQVYSQADAVLHLKFTEVGLFSPRSSLSYLPRVDAYAVLFAKGREDYLYDQEIYYGVDARKGNAWAISADEKFAYPSFDVVLSNADSVRQAFDTGAREIAKRMAEQIRESLK